MFSSLNQLYSQLRNTYIDAISESDESESLNNVFSALVETDSFVLVLKSDNGSTSPALRWRNTLSARALSTWESDNSLSDSEQSNLRAFLLTFLADTERDDFISKS